MQDSMRESVDGMEPMKEVCNLFFVDKLRFMEKDVLKNTCQALNSLQILELLDRFIPDEVSPTPVPKELFEKLKIQESLSKGERLEME